MQRVFLISGLVLAVTLPASVFAVGPRLEQSAVVGTDEIIDGNFIKFASIIEINGAVNGDVIAAGSHITISGPVAGDVIVAGANVRISGPVGGSVRAAGSVVEVRGEVERNVWALGSSVVIDEASNVGWDLYAAGANVEVRAPVGRSLRVSGANVILAESIGGDATVSLDKQGQLVLAPSATLVGDLTYFADRDEQLIRREGATVGGEVFYQPPSASPELGTSRALAAAYFFFRLISFFALVVVGIVLVSLLPQKMLQAVEQMRQKPWRLIGRGFVFAIVAPVVAVLLAITIIGLPLALISLLLYLTLLYVSQVVAGFAIGLLLVNRFSREGQFKGSLIWPLLVGLLIVVGLTSTPVVDWALKILLVLWATGALLIMIQEHWREVR